MIGRSFLELIAQGGTVMLPLLVCSVASIAVIIDRLWWLTRIGRQTRTLARAMVGALQEGGIAEASALCRTATGPVADVFRAALAPHGSTDSMERTVQRKLGAVTRSLRRRVWLLGTVGSLAPFIGLFGTVLGIVRSFESMAASGSGGFAVVAAGISEALIATAGGLFVGVLSIFTYNAFNVRIGSLSAALRDAADEVVQLLGELPARDGAVPRVVQSR